MTEIAEFDKAMVALQLELPEPVWQDVWRRWCDVRRAMSPPAEGDDE
jgi:hypothetical protein